MELERDFGAWLDRRDAEALGRVFDATGGKLLLLATHLAGSGSLGQDLVQATFLAAMGRGATWDRQRPLWPWLAAILQNELRMQMRHDRRRREVDLAGATMAQAGAADPERLAASQEVLDAVLRAIDALPLPYRQVLRLRLVHGLRPVEIARSLEVPVGTVRAQLHRGLEQLRGALPAGVAGALAALFTGEGALLAQVRARVLEQAMTTESAAAGAAGAWWIAGGWWTMNAKTVGVVVAACVALACLGFVLGVPEWIAGRGTPAAGVLSVRPEAGDDARTARVPAAAVPERRLVDAAVEPAWPLVVTVRTRAGEPIAGAEVQVWMAPPCLQIENQVHGAFLREDVAAGATGMDGVFRASLDALRSRSDLYRRTNALWVRAQWPHGRPRQQLLAVPRTTEPRSMTAVIDLDRRQVIVGRVVDADGAAIAGARVVWASPSSNLEYSDHIVTDARGAFCLDPVDEPERWPAQLTVVDPRAGTATVPVPPRAAGGAAVDLGAIVLAATDVVRGRVVLGDGTALAHIPVHLVAIDSQIADDPAKVRAALHQPGERAPSFTVRGRRVVQNRARSNTQPDGSFQFAGLDPTATYVVYVRRVMLCCASTVVRAGDDPVQLRVEAQLLTIEVRAGRDELVPGTRLLAEGYEPDNKQPSWKLRPGFPETGLAVSNLPFAADPEGRLLLLSPFRWVWRIGTRDEIAQPAFLRHDVLPGLYRATRTLELQAETRFGTLHLVVVDERGEPINHGARLHAVDRDLSRNDDRTVPPVTTWDLPAGAWRLHVLLGKEVVYSHVLDAYVRGFHEQVVAIEDGRTTEVKVEAKPAGMIAFRLHATHPPAGAWKDLRIEETGKEIAVVPHDREFAPGPAAPSPLPLMFLTRQALAPGKHAFLVQAAGYQPATCEVDVVADELVSVRVEMLAR